jgi:Reverse transcriptase (RNA-dependent DNA polymerase)
LEKTESKKSGNLNKAKYWKKWRAITRNAWVTKLVQNGLKVNMAMASEQKKEPREMEWTVGSDEQEAWKEKAMQWEAIEKVPEGRIGEKGELVHNLVAEEKMGRLCSNTRDLNQAVKKMKLKMESIKDVRQRFKEGHWLLAVDLSKFYWSLMINPSHRRYFRFRIDGELWQWRGLPFGFKNSMQIMARLMAPVIAKMESWGIEVINWVDDFVLQLGTDKEEAESKAAKALELIQSLGLYINKDKTAKEVTKEVTFRGFIWNTEEMTVRAPKEKLEDIKKTARDLDISRSTPRKLASLVGKVRYVAQIHTHLIAYIVEMEIFKNKIIKDGGWDQWEHLPESVKDEIHHWRTRTGFLTMPMRYSRDGATWTQGDAGPLGFGFEGFREMAGTWTEYERQQSTNYREILTWRIEVIEFCEELEEEVSFYGTDSTVAKCYISKIYGKEPVLTRMVAEVWKFMETKRMIQIPVHISQEEIAVSDHLSRLRDKYDFTVPQATFEGWCEIMKVSPTLDAFATRFSTKTERFCCSKEDTQAVALDTFSVSWRGEVVYAFPPEHLLHRVLTKAEEENVTLLLVYPLIKGASWYHRISRLADKSLSVLPEALVYPVPTLAPPWRWRISVIRGCTQP